MNESGELQHYSKTGSTAETDIPNLDYFSYCPSKAAQDSNQSDDRWCKNIAPLLPKYDTKCRGIHPITHRCVTQSTSTPSRKISQSTFHPHEQLSTSKWLGSQQWQTLHFCKHRLLIVGILSHAQISRLFPFSVPIWKLKCKRPMYTCPFLHIYA